MIISLTQTSGVAAENWPPISERKFTSSPTNSTTLKDGELDFTELLTRQNERQFSFLEVGCIVTEVRNVRSGRHHVKANCRKNKVIHEQQFFLDVLPKNKLRVDEHDPIACEWVGSISTSEAQLATKTQLENTEQSP